jgi:hypothetical protein
VAWNSTPVAVIRSTFVSSPTGTALTKTVTRSHRGRRTTKATAVDRAKKVISIPSPLHASATPIFRSLIRITLPSATAGSPSACRA